MGKQSAMKIGVGFIALACICWISVIVFPFVAMSVRLKVVSITGAVIIGEVLFWVGSMLLGKEVVQHYKEKLKKKR